MHGCRPLRQSRTFVLPLLGFLLLLPHAEAEELTAEKAVERCIEALGGQESWDAVQTMEWRGTFAGFSATHPFVLQRKRPNFYRFDHTDGNRAIVVGFDGQTAWWDSEMTLWSGAEWAVEMPVIYHAPIEAEAEFGGPLLDYREKGHRIDSLGTTELDGELYHGLEVHLKNGSVERWYLDLETFVPVARASTDAAALDVKKRRTFYSDYREIAGIRIPHHIEIELGHFYQVMDVEQVETNVTLDDGLFSLPVPAGMEALRSLAGTWGVKALSRGMPTLPWMETSAQATIVSSFHGGLLEEELSYVSSGRPRQLRRQWTYDRFAEVFRVTLFDSFTSHLNVLEGTFEDGRLVVSNVESETTWKLEGRTFHTREVIYDVEQDSFKVDRDTSFDGGRTWLTSDRLHYSRSE